uniref:Putative secreted protein n=1 Tax=Anopheles marajoara TaxID=58244 RepID=A0A2M4CEU8_9DIPT
MMLFMLLESHCLGVVFGLFLIVSSSALPRPPVQTVWYNMYYNTTRPKPYRELLEKVKGVGVSLHPPCVKAPK